MKLLKSDKIFPILKQLTTMTAMDLIRCFPEQWISLICTVVLSLIAALPVLMSLFFQEPLKDISHLLESAVVQHINIFSLGSQWYQAILLLGFPLGLMAALICAKRIDEGNFKDAFLRDSPRASLLPIGLLLMLLWSIPSALLSGNLHQCILGDEYRHEGVLTYFLYALIFIGALQLSEKQMRWVTEILCATCAITGILVITGGRIFQGLFFVDVELRAAMFHNSNHYGYFLAICFPICFGLVLEKKNSLVRWIEYWLICNAVAYSGCRGGFLGIFAAVVGWNISLCIQHKEKWKKCIALDLIFAITILVLHTESSLINRMSEIMVEIDLIQQDQTLNVVGDVGSGRGILWYYGIQFALEKPLFGYGPDNLGYAYSAIQSELSDRPHNELIQFAASLGLPALICYLTAIGSHAVTFVRGFRRLSIFHLTLFASAGSYLVSSLFGNTMYYTTPYYIMMLAFTYQICKPVNLVRE